MENMNNETVNEEVYGEVVVTKEPEKKKFRLGPWVLAFLPLVIAIAVNLALNVVFTLISSINITANAIANGRDMSTISLEETNAEILEKTISMAPTMQIVLEVAFLLIFCLWYKKLIKRETKVGIKKTLTGNNILWIVLASVLAEFAVVFEESVYIPLFPNSYQKLVDSMSMIGFGDFSVIVVVTVAIMAPIAEELIFRGVMLKLLTRAGAAPLAAIIIQGICFGVFHMNIIQGIYAAELGIILGYIAYKCKSVYPSILMHMVINFSGVIIGSLNIESEIPIALCAVLAVILGAATVFSVMRVREPEITE